MTNESYKFIIVGYCQEILTIGSDVNRLKNLNRLKMSFNRLIIAINRLIAIKNFNRLID